MEFFMNLLRLPGISLTSKPISPVVLGADAVLALFDGFYTPSPGALSILNPDSANNNGTKSASVHALQINISLFNGPTVPQKIAEKDNRSDGDSQQKGVHAEDKEAAGLMDYGLSHPDFSDGHENLPAQILLHADLSDLNAQAIDDAPLLQFTELVMDPAQLRLPRFLSCLPFFDLFTTLRENNVLAKGRNVALPTPQHALKECEGDQDDGEKTIANDNKEAEAPDGTPDADNVDLHQTCEIKLVKSGQLPPQRGDADNNLHNLKTKESLHGKANPGSNSTENDDLSTMITEHAKRLIKSDSKDLTKAFNINRGHTNPPDSDERKGAESNECKPYVFLPSQLQRPEDNDLANKHADNADLAHECNVLRHLHEDPSDQDEDDDCDDDEPANEDNNSAYFEDPDGSELPDYEDEVYDDNEPEPDADDESGGNDEDDYPTDSANTDVQDDTSIDFQQGLSLLLLSPLRGSNGDTQARKKHYAAHFIQILIQVKPLARVKKKSELLLFFMMKAVIDPG